MSSAAPPVPPAAASGPDGLPHGDAPSGEGAERPELLVGAAFAGGLALAMILKRLGH